MPFWLKFALIFTLIIVILFVAGFLIEGALGVESDMGTPTLWALAPVMLPVLLLLRIFGITAWPAVGPGWIGSVYTLIIALIYFFVVGSIIGFIAQLIKALFRGRTNKNELA